MAQKTLIIDDVDSLKKKLAEYKIDISDWGIGDAKTVENLLSELKKDDCALTEMGGGYIEPYPFYLSL